MRNLFVGYGDNNYLDLSNVMSKSLISFSNFKLKLYDENDFSVNMNQTKDKIFMEFCKIKLLCVIDAIKNDMSDNYVWIDVDTVANHNIDKIWFESWRISDYPLMGKYRYKNILGFNDGGFPYAELLYKMNIKSDAYTSFRQANFMLFDKSCLNFFEECIHVMNTIDNVIDDESVINALFMKYNYTNNLGHINICSESYYDEILKFSSLKDRDLYPNLIPVIENNYENVLIFHGTKDVNKANAILNSLLKRKEL